MRLDRHLVEIGSFDSRARAQAAIRAGLVRVDGAVVVKPSLDVSSGARVVVDGDVHDFVSRGGVKLHAAMDTFAIDPAGAVCLDLGASTGGFTEVLLRRGAARIYAVDVGRGQLHPLIASDRRVINLEATHAKDLTPALIPEPVSVLVCDVSFISLKKALPPALSLCARAAQLVALVKPQFEVGRSRIGKGGIVAPTHENTCGVAEDIAAWIATQPGWKAHGVMESPIVGGDGNREFLLGAVRST